MFPNKQILRGYAENCAILCPSANYESSLRMDGHKARDIVDIRIETFETRHVTEQARCECCGSVTGAPDGLPRKGSYGRGLRLDPLLFFKPAHPAFQARFRQTACSASHSNLWFTSPHTMSLMRSYVFSGFRYLSPMIRHVLTLRIACST